MTNFKQKNSSTFLRILVGLSTMGPVLQPHLSYC